MEILQFMCHSLKKDFHPCLIHGIGKKKLMQLVGLANHLEKIKSSQTEEG